MSRDKSFDWRMDGMTLAYMIVANAKREGADPLTALAHEILFRKKSGVNIPTMSQKEIDAQTLKIKQHAIKTVLAISMMVLWEQHNFRRPALMRFMKTFNTYTSALVSDSIVWADVLECLKTECGMVIDDWED